MNDVCHFGGDFMTRKLYIAVFFLLNALAVCLTHSSAHSGEAKKEVGRNQADSHISSKGAANNNARWSADPERGWVRADERREQREESGQASKGKKNGGKHRINGRK